MAGTIASIFAAIAGIVATVAAIAAWRVSKRELTLAEEEAKLRPRIEVSFKTVAFHILPPDTTAPYEQAAIVFDITNNGRTAAHGVRCEFSVDEPLGPNDPMTGTNYPFQAQYIGPKQTFSYDVRVSVYGYGSATARYSCICDEVGESEGLVEFEVRNTDRQ